MCATSSATKLVADDTNGKVDVFLRDRTTHVTLRVSLGVGGTQANAFSGEPTISSEGRYVGFTSKATDLVVPNANESADVFLRDLLAEVTILISVSRPGVPARKDSYRPAISADGQFVGFTSDAGNLVVGDTNKRADVFVLDWGSFAAHGCAYL